MMNYKQLKMSLLALLLLFAAAPPSPAAEKSFHILMINDPHSYILPYYEADKAGLPAGAVKVGPCLLYTSPSTASSGRSTR